MLHRRPLKLEAVCQPSTSAPRHLFIGRRRGNPALKQKSPHSHSHSSTHSTSGQPIEKALGFVKDTAYRLSERWNRKYQSRRRNKGVTTVERAERDTISWLERMEGLHKPICIALAPAYVLGAVSSVIGLPTPVWAPTLVGAAIGSTFALLNRHLKVRVWLAPTMPLSVIITGGSKGLGKALAREFLQHGDRVLITSRTDSGLQEALTELRKQLVDGAQVYGVVCDVSDADSVARLDSAARRLMGGRVDAWVNNAGYSGSFQSFLDASDEQLTTVVRTNLLGTLLCSRQALRLFGRQTTGGHIFNMDGAGADGQATPNYSAYGATKAGIVQLTESLAAEASAAAVDGGGAVRLHTLSPGMILTDLLLEGATVANKQAFNVLCEQPETVAAFLVPRLRSIVARGEGGQYVRYLTGMSAMYRLLTAPGRIGRFFDSAGNAVYPPESERLNGKFARSTARAAAAARRRNHQLQLAYSASVILSVAALFAESRALAS